MLTEQQRCRFSGALERLAGDENMFLRVAEIVLEDAPALIQQSRSAIEGNDFEHAVAPTHKLKGLLATFINPNGDPNFAPVMTAVRANKDVDAAEQWRKIEPQIDALMEEINQLGKTA